MQLVIRQMQPEDVDACAVIEQTAADAWSRPQLEQELCHQRSGGAPRLFVAQKGSEIAGLAVFQLAAGEASLYALTIAPALRGQGIGRALLCGSMQQLCSQGAQCFFLEVRATNAAAIALYESIGFVKAGLRKNFYANPCEDGIVMSMPT